MAVTEAGTRVKEAAAGSAIVRPWRPPSTGIAATGYGFVEVLMASPTLGVIGEPLLPKERPCQIGKWGSPIAPIFDLLML